MQLWYHKYGYKRNPLTIKPGKELTGASKIQDIMLNIVRKGGICFIEGQYGCGKSTILQSLVREFGGNGRVAYYSVNRKERSLHVDGLLNGTMGFFGRMFGRKPKEVIMLLDEVQDLYAQDQRKLLEYYYSGMIQAIVLVSHSLKACDFIPELVDEIEHATFRMGVLSTDDAVKLIRTRLGQNLFTDDAIMRVFQYDKNPRSFLKNCEDVCRWAHQRGIPTLNETHVDEVLRV